MVNSKQFQISTSWTQNNPEHTLAAGLCIQCGFGSEEPGFKFILTTDTPYLRICFHSRKWRHHQMETFSTLLTICVGNSAVTGEFPAQRPVMRSFDVFVDLRLNKWLNEQLRGWWFETPSCPLRRYCNLMSMKTISMAWCNITVCIFI